MAVTVILDNSLIIKERTAHALLEEYLAEMNSLVDKLEFYDALFHNCTTTDGGSGSRTNLPICNQSYSQVEGNSRSIKFEHYDENRILVVAMLAPVQRMVFAYHS